MQSSAQSLKIQVGQLGVCYQDLGTGGTPLIFIHGFPFDKSSWGEQVNSLHQAQRVIAYDVRGFCKSKPDDNKVSISLFADDLIFLMDALHIKEAIVCGLSMGGYIALNAISRYPERFKALVLADTQCAADTEEAKEKRYKSIEQIQGEGLEDYANDFVEKIFCRQSKEERPEIVDSIRQTILSTPVTTVARTLSAIAQRTETCSMLDKIQVPTLIVCGEEDIVTPPEKSRYMHQHIQNSELHIIKGAGHMSNMEQPQVFNRHLLNFMARLA